MSSEDIEEALAGVREIGDDIGVQARAVLFAMNWGVNMHEAAKSLRKSAGHLIARLDQLDARLDE